MAEKDIIDILLDEEDNSNVVLFDENEQPVEFEQEAVIPMEEGLFFILRPIVTPPGMAVDEAFAFELKESEEFDDLVQVEDQELLDKIFAAYNELCDEEGIEK